MSVPPRTNSNAVILLMGDDFGLRADGSTPDLAPYIASASAMVDRVQVCALARMSPITLTTVELELIERWLSAHLYTKSDPTYSSKNTQGASGSFIRGPENAEPYRDGAINVDYSGCLNAILRRQFAGSLWLGKPPSAQIPVEDRD